MFIPVGPSAGPTGGAGLALPASICSFTTCVTFFSHPSESPNPSEDVLPEYRSHPAK